jgi:hypothetical protein
MPEVSNGFSDLNVILRHYSQLIEEDFMDRPQAATIAWEIHRKYPKLINFLSANGPVQQIKGEIRVLLSETDGCLFEKEKADESSFALSHWHEEPLLISGPIDYSTSYYQKLWIETA